MPTQNMTNYNHITFDVDGTLLNTEYAVLHSLQDTMRTVSGKEIALEDLSFSLGITGEDALKILGIKNIAPTLDLWVQNLHEYANTVTVFDGITELLKNLLQLNYKLGIITSRTREEFEDDFCAFGIRHYFHTIVCADDTAKHKPDAEPLLKYMELSGVDRRHILYIGDSEYDSLCAKNAGTDFALAGWGCYNDAIRAEYRLEKPTELLSVIMPNVLS